MENSIVLMNMILYVTSKNNLCFKCFWKFCTLKRNWLKTKETLNVKRNQHLPMICKNSYGALKMCPWLQLNSQSHMFYVTISDSKNNLLPLCFFIIYVRNSWLINYHFTHNLWWVKHRKHNYEITKAFPVKTDNDNFSEFLNHKNSGW